MDGCELFNDIHKTQPLFGFRNRKIETVNSINNVSCDDMNKENNAPVKGSNDYYYAELHESEARLYDINEVQNIVDGCLFYVCYR